MFSVREAAQLVGVSHGQEDALAIQRLLDEVERAAAGRLHGRVDRAVPRDHDDQGLGLRLPDLLEDLQAVLARHLDVQERQVDVRVVSQSLKPRLPVLGQHDLVVLEAQHEVQALPDGDLVVDDQDLHGILRTPGPRTSHCRDPGWRDTTDSGRPPGDFRCRPRIVGVLQR